MKKLFSFLPALALCANLCAQTNTFIKAGASFANLHYKSENNTLGRVAGYAGLAVSVDLLKQLFFQPEILYSIRGYRFRATTLNSKGHVSYGYITLPLLLGYKASKNFSILAGPEIGYMVRARSHFDGDSYDIIQNVGRRFNVDADAGIAWLITPELSLDARFSFGVTALYRGILTDQFGNEIGRVNDGYHRVLQLGLALAL